MAGRHARDYYEASAPSHGQQPDNGPAPTGPEGTGEGNHEMVPTFTQQSIGQGGAQLYSGSIATPTPQAFNVASPPPELNGYGVRRPGRRPKRLRTAHRLISTRFGAGFAVTELQPLVYSHYTFWPRRTDPHHLAVLARPASVRAACRRPRRFPGSGCPQASPRCCDSQA